MEVKAEGIGHTRVRTTAEIVENFRFDRLLATLDPATAMLLQQERTRWILAEIARRQELARLEERDRLLSDLAAMW